MNLVIRSKQPISKCKLKIDGKLYHIFVIPQIAYIRFFCPNRWDIAIQDRRFYKNIFTSAYIHVDL
jgi:hypothetical protein